MKNEEKSFEDALKELEVIVKELEEGKTPLEQAIDKYSEAMKLVKYCGEKLKSAQDRVNKILNSDGTLEDFDIKDE